MISIYILSGLLCYYKDFNDLHYKLTEFHLIFWPYKHQQLRQNSIFLLSLDLWMKQRCFFLHFLLYYDLWDNWDTYYDISLNNIFELKWYTFLIFLIYCIFTCCLRQRSFRDVYLEVCTWTGLFAFLSELRVWAHARIWLFDSFSPPHSLLPTFPKMSHVK